MKAFYFLLVLISLAAWAQSSDDTTTDASTEQVTARFFISDQVGTGHIKVCYNQDVVEDFVEDVLEQMGATPERIWVIGGLQDPPPYKLDFCSASVRANFSVTSAEGEWHPVTLEGDNCHLAQETFAGLRDHFELRNVDTGFYCFRPGDPHRITFEVRY